MFSVFNPSKCTHTWSSGQPTLRRPGSSWGFGALLKGLTSVVDNSCRSRDSNPQPWVTSLTLYPLEPLWLKSWMKIVESKDVLRIKRFLLKNCIQPKTISQLVPALSCLIFLYCSTTPPWPKYFPIYASFGSFIASVIIFIGHYVRRH